MAGYAFGNGLMLDPAEEFRAGGERGRQSRLRDLMGKAATADPEQRGGLLGQIMATDPETGFKAQKAFGEADDDAFDAITRTASMMVSAPPQLRQSLYPRLVQATRRVMPQAQFPEAWDETWLPHIRDLSRMATKAGDTPAQQQYAEWLLGQVPADKRDKTLGFLAGYESRPSSAAIQYKDGVDAQGNPFVSAYDPRQVGAHVIGTGETYGSGVGQPAPMQAPPQRMDEDAIHRIATEMGRAGVPEPQVAAWLQKQLSAALYVDEVPDTSPQAIPSPAPQPSALPPRLDYQNRGTVNPWRGRRKEDETAAVEEAKKRAALQYDPVIEGAKQNAKNASDLGQYESLTPLTVARESAVAEARETATALGKTRADEAKKKLAAHDTTALLNAAELLLPKATGSLAGSMADTGAAAFGKSTEGARATAGLKAIAGQLTAKMPRMEGPQSNYDVLLYKEMAGDLANDKLPVETRMAALNVIRELQKRYTGGQPPAPAQQGAPGGVIRYDAQGNRIP